LYQAAWITEKVPILSRRSTMFRYKYTAHLVMFHNCININDFKKILYYIAPVTNCDKYSPEGEILMLQHVVNLNCKKYSQKTL